MRHDSQFLKAGIVQKCTQAEEVWNPEAFPAQLNVRNPNLGDKARYANHHPSATGGETVSITLEILNDQAMQRSDLDELRILS
jgi:hypothetical protein